MKRTQKILLILILLLVLFFGVTYAVTPLVLLHPVYNEEAAEELNLIGLQELFAEKRSMNMPLIEAVTIETHEGSLHGWRLHQNSNTYTEESRLLLYFGGFNEDSASSALRFLEQMTETDAFAGTDIAIVDWPGYGTSEGVASDQSIRDASVSIYRYFKAQESVTQICIMGYSFGTGPAVYVASLEDPDGLILLAPYESAFDLYNSVTPVFYGPMKLLISFRMESGEYAEKVRCRPLIIASKKDQRIPFESSEALAGHFSAGCDFLALESVSHGEIPEAPETLAAIQAYLNP